MYIEPQCKPIPSHHSEFYTEWRGGGDMQQHLSYKPSGAPEATRKNLREPKFKHFLVNITRQSQEHCASHDRFFPLHNKTSCMKPCHYTLIMRTCVNSY